MRKTSLSLGIWIGFIKGEVKSSDLEAIPFQSFLYPSCRMLVVMAGLPPGWYTCLHQCLSNRNLDLHRGAVLMEELVILQASSNKTGTRVCLFPRFLSDSWMDIGCSRELASS